MQAELDDLERKVAEIQDRYPAGGGEAMPRFEAQQLDRLEQQVRSEVGWIGRGR